MTPIGVIGIGYAGLINGICFANCGIKTICADIDAKKIESLKQGIPTIFENNLEESLNKAIMAKNITFTTNLNDAINKSDIIFLTVGTPQGKNGEADISAIKNAAKSIGKHINSYKIIVNKSTVPLGTAELVKEIIFKEQKKRMEKGEIKAKIPFAVVSNPEFLSEGNAIEDFTNERVVIGADGEKEKEIMKNLYEQAFTKNKQIIFTDTKSAELIKYASNAMLAMRISFMNELSELSEKTGADINAVSKGMGLDPRIGGKFLRAGAGYGGSCFPKDVRALEMMLKKNKCDGKIIKAIDEVNERQKARLIDKVKSLVPKLSGKTICVLGLSYKPNTDDIRESPSIVLINALQREGAKIKAYDPKAMENAKKHFNGVEFAKNSSDALNGADAVVIITEWDEFKNIDIQKMKQLLKQPNLFDARNVFDPKEMRKAGFNYVGIGR